MNSCVTFRYLELGTVCSNFSEKILKTNSYPCSVAKDLGPYIALNISIVRIWSSKFIIITQQIYYGYAFFQKKNPFYQTVVN